MFQLIVSVISIALVAALAIASIFYGGDAFTKSSEKATITTLINQAQQIAGASALYKTNEGVNVPTGNLGDTHDLIADGYLAQAPGGAKVTVEPTSPAGAWTIVDDSGVRKAQIPFATGVDAASLCAEVAKQAVGDCYGTNTDSKRPF